MQLFQPVEPILTALPATPVDGQIINFLADDTNGVVWRLRYRAASASAYKWEFIGGSPLLNVLTGATTMPVSAYGNLAAGAERTFTLALAGDYIIEVGADLSPGAPGLGMFISFSVNGATALDTDAALAYYGSTTPPGQSGNHNVALKTALPANTTIQAKYKMQGPTTAGNVDRRYIKITPIRVG